MALIAILICFAMFLRDAKDLGILYAYFVAIYAGNDNYLDKFLIGFS